MEEAAQDGSVEELQGKMWNTLVELCCQPLGEKFDTFLPFEIMILTLDKMLKEVEKLITSCLDPLADEFVVENVIVLPPNLPGKLGLTSGRFHPKPEFSWPGNLSRLFRTFEETKRLKSEETKQHVLSLLQNNPVFSVKAETIEVKPELVSDDDDDEHEGSDLCCPKCGEVLDDSQSLKSHLKSHEPRDEECKQCHKRFKTKLSLKTHVKRFHELKVGDTQNLKCFYCPEVFQEEKERIKHEREHKGPWECHDCGKVLANKDIFKQHQRDLHSGTHDCICDSCGMSFKNQRYLKDHIRNRHSGKSILCVDCGKQFKPSAFADHRKYKHALIPLERISCEICDKTFRSKLTLKSHLAIVHETGIKTVLHCKYCTRKCISQAQMKKHVMAMHLGVKVSCPICAKEFSHKDSMMKHQALVHGKGDRDVLYCDQCPTKFISKAKLKEHIAAKHLGIKHVCTNCSKEYSRKHKLVKHIKTGKCLGNVVNASDPSEDSNALVNNV